MSRSWARGPGVSRERPPIITPSGRVDVPSKSKGRSAHRRRTCPRSLSESFVDDRGPATLIQSDRCSGQSWPGRGEKPASAATLIKNASWEPHDSRDLHQRGIDTFRRADRRRSALHPWRFAVGTAHSTIPPSPAEVDRRCASDPTNPAGARLEDFVSLEKGPDSREG